VELAPAADLSGVERRIRPSQQPQDLLPHRRGERDVPELRHVLGCHPHSLTTQAAFNRRVIR
jgi:hypothetical protein